MRLRTAYLGVLAGDSQLGRLKETVSAHCEVSLLVSHLPARKVASKDIIHNVSLAN